MQSVSVDDEQNLPTGGSRVFAIVNPNPEADLRFDPLKYEVRIGSHAFIVKRIPGKSLARLLKRISDPDPSPPVMETAPKPAEKSKWMTSVDTRTIIGN